MTTILQVLKPLKLVYRKGSSELIWTSNSTSSPKRTIDVGLYLIKSYGESNSRYYQVESKRVALLFDDIDYLKKQEAISILEIENPNLLYILTLIR